jgi:predicted permease
MMALTGFTERAIAGVYRALLLLYPKSYRADFAGDMEETFVDRYREARAHSAYAAVGFLLAETADVGINGLRERIIPHAYGYGMFHWMDVRYAFRLIRRSPFFSLLTLVTLSGGLGLSMFTFSFLHTAMLKPLPLAGGDRIVRVLQSTPGAGGGFDVVDLAAMRASITTLSTVGAFTGRDIVIGDDRHRRVLHATAAESNLFDVARVRPLLGRALRSEDQLAGAEPVIVLGYWAWTSVFGADSTILNRQVPLNGAYTRVVGVMPQGYGFPVAAEAWVPLGADVLATPTPGTYEVDLYGRLANGVTAERASTELARLLARAKSLRPAPPNTVVGPANVDVQSFPMAQIGDDAPLAFTVLNLLATLILLLACINVTNLLLARANERARETAVRLALGASRGRLIVQSMWENVVICLLGGAMATALAAWGLGAINQWMQNNLQRNLAFWWVWGLDRATLLSACAFVTATIAVFGCVVSARVVNTEFNAVLRDGGTRTGSRREGRVARALVITQVATVSVLMFFGVMSSVVAYRVAHVDVGYATHNLLSASIDLPRKGYESREMRARFFQRAFDGLAASAAVDGGLMRSSIAGIDDRQGAFEAGSAVHAFTAASPHAYVEGVLGSMRTLGITLSAGRPFDARDDDRGAPVAIISRSLAQRFWPNRSAIGERIRIAGDSGVADSRVVVGVVSDILMGNPFSRNRSAAAIYVPLRQTDVTSARIVFKHRGDAPAAQAALYSTLASVDPRLTMPDVQTFEEILGTTTLIAKSVTKLFAMCFGFALLLAVSGTYGLMARSIGQRTREVGIRRAMGATEGNIVRLLLGQGGRQLGIGVFIALPVMIAVGVGFWMYFPIGLAVSMLSAGLVSATIVSVVLLATYVPTRRAIAVSPRDALWRE